MIGARSKTGKLRQRLPRELADRLIYVAVDIKDGQRYITASFFEREISSRYHVVHIDPLDWLTDAMIARICLEVP